MEQCVWPVTPQSHSWDMSNMSSLRCVGTCIGTVFARAHSGYYGSAEQEEI